jgi:hypothetical protein
MAVLDLLPKKKKKAGAPTRLAAQVPRYRPAVSPSPNPPPAFLVRNLRGLARRFRLVNAGRWLFLYVAAAFPLLIVQMFVDWLMDLSVLVRAVLLLGDFALLAFFFRKQLLPLVLRPPGLEQCALMVEKRWPFLKGRVIATIQLGAPRFTRDSPELIQALHEETRKHTAYLKLKEIVPTRPLVRNLAAALIAAGLFAALFVAFRPGSLALLERVFLLPARVPRKTVVICLSGNKTIPAGQSVVLEAQARGIVPSHGRVTIVDDTGRIQEITLDPEPGHSDLFSLTVASVERPMTYTIRLNDGSSGEYRIDTVPSPYVVSIDCQQIYPAYTGLAPIKRTVENLALLAGSKLQLHAMANGKIVRATIKLVGLNREKPMTLSGADNKELTGEIDIPSAGLTGFSIMLTNQAGITAGDKIEYRVDLIPDRPPTIQLTSPDRLEELFTLNGQAVIAYTASDDYGLAKVSLCYRILQGDDDTADNTPDTSANASGNSTAPTPDSTTTPAAADAGAAAPAAPPVQKIPMDLAANHPTNAQGTYPWNLTAMKPPLREGLTIEYWMEAQDANDVTGPGVSESEHHTIKIVSEMEKRADVMNRLLDKLSNLKDISEDQNKINQSLHNALEGKPAPK